jgi:hypothetical protein
LEAAFFVLDRRGRTPRILVLSTAARDFRRSRQFMEPLAHRAWKPPTSSSIAEEEHLVSLVLSTAARDFRRSQQFMEPLAHRAWKPPTSSSIAEEEHLVSLVLSTAAHDFRRSQL